MTIPFIQGEHVEVFDEDAREWVRGVVARCWYDQSKREHVWDVRVGEGIAPLRARPHQIRTLPTRGQVVCPSCSRSIRDGMCGLGDHLPGCSEVFGAWTPEKKAIAARTDAAAQMLATLDVPDLDRETPGRLARALGELTDGYAVDVSALLKTFPIQGDHGIVHVKDVPFASLCAHHVLPFTGTATVAYIPKDKIVGLSKIPRLVRAFARRLQVQEVMGKQIADALLDATDSLGVMVILKGRHTCCSTRGVEAPCEMITSYVLGCFKSDHAARAEAIALIG